MSNIRHVVIVRKDLQMPVGLLAAQVAHINDNFMRTKIVSTDYHDSIVSRFNATELDWMENPYLSVLAVNCFEDLQNIIEAAKKEGLNIYEWTDLVTSPTFPDRTIKTLIGISIGPDDFDKIKKVTGSLPLY